MKLQVKEFITHCNEDLKNKISKLKKKPILSTIRVGEDFGSKSFEKSILNQASKIGIEVDVNILDGKTSFEEIKTLIEVKNEDNNINGILVFSPIKNQNMSDIFELIDLEKDVDGQNLESILNIFKTKDYFNVATTAVATLEYLRSLTNLEGKDVLIVNNSLIIGKPLALMLQNERATVTIAHSRTKDIYEKIKKSDIIVTAVGIANLFDIKEFKEDAIIIDLGYSMDENGKASGDVINNFENNNVNFLPSVGGIGRINSSIIIRNTYLNEVRNGK